MLIFLKSLAFGNVVKSIFKLISFLLTLLLKKSEPAGYLSLLFLYIKKKELTLYSAFMVIFPAVLAVDIWKTHTQHLHIGSQPVCFFNLGCPVISPAPRWVRTDGTKSKRWEMMQKTFESYGLTELGLSQTCRNVAGAGFDICAAISVCVQNGAFCHDPHGPVSC